MPTKPISPKRLAANRANAAHSTGPRTPQGKARAAQNSRNHHFFPDRFAVVRLEEAGALAKLRADLIATYQPVNSQELFAIERMALAQQSILRAATIESGLLTCCLNEAIDPDGHPVFLLQPDLTQDIAVTAAQNRAHLLAEGFLRQSRASNAIQQMFRYLTTSERQYRRALEEFERLKKLRAELPNEPIVDPELEEPKPVVPESTNPTDPPKPPYAPLYKPVPVDPTIAVTSPNPPRFPRRDHGT